MRDFTRLLLLLSLSALLVLCGRREMSENDRPRRTDLTPITTPIHVAVVQYLAEKADAIAKSTAARTRLNEAPNTIALIDKDHAVARVLQPREGSRPAKDHYFYATKKSGSWRVTTWRTLATYGTLDVMLGLQKHSPSTDPETLTMIKNLRLTLKTDTALRAWYNKNKNTLEAILGAFVDGNQRTVSAQEDSTVGKLLGAHGLSVITAVDHGNVEIVIGGAADNTVGFLFSPNARPPKIDPDAHIWIEKLAEQWYLFRTT